jgi:hypothetical protein
MLMALGEYIGLQGMLPHAPLPLAPPHMLYPSKQNEHDHMSSLTPYRLIQPLPIPPPFTTQKWPNDPWSTAEAVTKARKTSSTPTTSFLHKHPAMPPDDQRRRIAPPWC